MHIVFWYLLPFALAYIVHRIIRRKSLNIKYYWLAYFVFIIPVVLVARNMAYGSRDEIRVFIEVLSVYHAPVVVPGLMILPILLMMFFLQCLGLGRKRIEQ